MVTGNALVNGKVMKFTTAKDIPEVQLEACCVKFSSSSKGFSQKYRQQWGKASGSESKAQCHVCKMLLLICCQVVFEGSGVKSPEASWKRMTACLSSDFRAHATSPSQRRPVEMGKKNIEKANPQLNQTTNERESLGRRESAGGEVRENISGKWPYLGRSLKSAPLKQRSPVHKKNSDRERRSKFQQGDENRPEASPSPEKRHRRKAGRKRNLSPEGKKEMK